MTSEDTVYGYSTTLTQCYIWLFGLVVTVLSTSSSCGQRMTWIFAAFIQICQSLKSSVRPGCSFAVRAPLTIPLWTTAVSSSNNDRDPFSRNGGISEVNKYEWYCANGSDLQLAHQSLRSCSSVLLLLAALQLPIDAILAHNFDHHWICSPSAQLGISIRTLDGVVAHFQVIPLDGGVLNSLAVPPGSSCFAFRLPAMMYCPALSPSLLDNVVSKGLSFPVIRAGFLGTKVRYADGFVIQKLEGGLHFAFLQSCIDQTSTRKPRMTTFTFGLRCVSVGIRK